MAAGLALHPRFSHLDDNKRLALITRITIPAVGLALSNVYGELTDIDAAYAATVEPVIARVLEERPSDDLLGAGRTATADAANRG
jgi:hypothetical protein